MIPLPKLELFPCPGCGRTDGAHPPLCQVAVRLTAAEAASTGDGWRSRLLLVSVHYVNLFGSRWNPIARHYRCAACDTPDPTDRGEPLVYAPADNLLKLDN